MKILNKVLSMSTSLYFKVSHTVFAILAYPCRVFFYKRIGLLTYVSYRSSIKNHHKIKLGNFAQINPYVILWPTSLQIGNHSQINPGTAIYGDVSIGNYVMIAPNCSIMGGNHIYTDTNNYIMHQGSRSIGIVIEDDVWIGANCTILDGVTIGKGAIIGAHSNVTRNIPPYCIAFGNPAKVVKWRINN